MSLFVRSKFAGNLLTHNRRGSFIRERRRNIKIFQAFIVWKAPSIMCYRRVQFGLVVAKLTCVQKFIWIILLKFFEHLISLRKADNRG